MAFDWSKSQVHLIGIAGIGVSALAHLLCDLGCRVSGSDQRSNAITEGLVARGVRVEKGHAAEHVEQPDLVVYSSAIAADNPELVKAKAQGCPTISRGELLALIVQQRRAIAVAGTHGKTTTTALLSAIFLTAKLDPTVVVGGILMALATNAYLGQGEWAIVEADESDASFLHLSPEVAVVTNVEADHMATYDHDVSQLQRCFGDFIESVPDQGLGVVCYDDAGVQAILPRLSKPWLGYGFSAEADVRADHVQACGATMQFVVTANDRAFDVTLNMMGRHNVLNALAAITVALYCNISISVIQKALLQFEGIGRRTQYHGRVNMVGKTVELIDDYGHHPSEIAATISGARQGWPDRRLILCYQLHRYSRTRDHFSEFVEVLSQVDELMLLPIYAASEQPIEGIDTDAVLVEVKKNMAGAKGHYCEHHNGLVSRVHALVEDGDVVVVMGAGDIAACVPLLAD